MDTISIINIEWHDGEQGVTFLINGSELIELAREHGGRADMLLLRSV